MNGVTLVTLSRFPDLFVRLAESVDRYEPRAVRRVVIKSGDLPFPPSSFECLPGVEPFIFARSANDGIRLAGRDDVLLINDDCRLCMPLVEPLRELAYRDPAVGLIAPQVIGGVGNPCQQARPGDSERYPSPMRIAFVCVYLPRATIDRVGLLDERFDGYGGDDDDYCLRVREAGLSLMIAGQVRVEHGTAEQLFSTSFSRVMTAEEQNRSLYRMAEVFAEKHGIQGGQA